MKEAGVGVLTAPKKTPDGGVDRVFCAVARDSRRPAASLSLVESETRRFSGCARRTIRGAQEFSGSGQYISRRPPTRSSWLSSVARRRAAGDAFESQRSARTLGPGGEASTGDRG